MIVGSKAFFSSYADFKPKDTDYLQLVDKGDIFTNFLQAHCNGFCCFEYVKKSKEEMIKDALMSKSGMVVGKFLVLEFINELNMTIEDLKTLKPLIERLDEKHLYEKVIYDSYIQNNDFYLTQEQLDEAYKIYKLYRQ